MNKMTLVVDGVSDEPDYPLTVLANMLAEAGRRLEILEESTFFPAITIQVEREGGWLKLSVVQQHEADGVERPLASGELAVGYYVPTPEFLAIPEHTAVMDAATQELVATTGPAGDPASQADAKLFAASRIMREALQAVSEQLAAWSLNGGVLDYKNKNVSNAVFWELNRLESVLENALVTATGEW